MRLLAVLRVLVAVGVMAGLLCGLWLLPAPTVPWHDLAGWLDRTPPEDALTAVARLLAMAGLLVVLATTMLYALAVVGRAPALARAVGHWTLPIVRRAVDGALAGTVVLAALTPMAARASEAAPTTTVVALAPPAYVPVPAGDGSSAEAAVTVVESEDVQPSTPAIEAVASQSVAEMPTTYIIRRGDNLWSIAASIVAGELGRRPSDHEVAPYWRRLIMLNLPHLSSGDPNIVYAGELLELPKDL